MYAGADESWCCGSDSVAAGPKMQIDISRMFGNPLAAQILKRQLSSDSSC